MSKETKELREVAEKAKVLLYNGVIDLKEAKKQVKPYIDAVNEKSRELAKKYNQRPRLVSVASFLR